MPATIAAVSAPVTPAAAGSTAPLQTSAGGAAKGGGDASGASKADAAAKSVEAPKLDAGAKPGETAAQKAARLKFKAKVDGREEEVEWDEGEAARSFQKLKHFEKTRGDFDGKQRQFDQQLEQLTKDPVGFFRERGVDLVELGQAEAQRQAALKAMDPRERELAETKAELDRLKQADVKRGEEAKVAQARAEHQQMVQGQVKLLSSAIEASKLIQPLPENATPADRIRIQGERGYLMKLFAEVQEMAVHNGEPELSAEQLAAAGQRLETSRFSKNIKSRLSNPAWRAANAGVVKELAQSLVGQLQGAELVELLGREAVARVTRESLSALRKSPIPIVAGPPSDTPPPPAPGNPRPKTAQGSASVWSQLDALNKQPGA